MYIAQALNVLHDWWRYIVGVIIAIAGVFVFSLPHIIGIGIKSLDGSVDQTKLNDVSYLMGLFEPNLNLTFLLLPFAGGLIFLFLAVKYLHQQTITQLTTSRPKIDWKRFWFAFVFWGILSSGLVFLNYTLEPEHFQLNFKLVPFLILCVIAVVLIPLQTSFEEYMFRGYLMQGIGVLTKWKWVPLIVTSVVFGLLHLSNPEVDKLGPIIMVYYIGTGLFWGIMTLMDEGIELSLGFHAANNLFTALLVTADWTALQTHSIFKDISNPESAGFLDVFLPVFVLYPIMLLIFSKIYKWNNWKDKLFGRVEEPPKEDYKIIE